MQTLEFIATIAASSAVTAALTAWLNRRKSAAETDNIIAKTYGDLIDELRNQVEFQATQIKALQEREVEYLKIINRQHEIEKQLREQLLKQINQKQL